MPRPLIVPAMILLLAAATPTPFGGWAVITIHDLPEYLVAGRPMHLAFTVRQHGQEPMNDLSPTATVRQKGDRRLWGHRTVKAARAGGPGRYEVTLTPQDTGDVSIAIDANWHSAKTTLMPIRVVAAGVVPEPLAPSARGRDLYVAKGCVSCHTKRDDRQMLDGNDVAIGPDLTARGLPDEWLAAKLADPARNRVRTNDFVVMPDLELEDREIAALVSYLNSRPGDAVAASK
jgi:mono/diheme cytochrome c family protein